ncbi:hypothetical protein Q3G72_014767 [Acer saccharum]|nr:hypothetical protein Q3G72_014767 [Acer saccharum]
MVPLLPYCPYRHFVGNYMMFPPDINWLEALEMVEDVTFTSEARWETVSTLVALHLSGVFSHSFLSLPISFLYPFCWLELSCPHLMPNYQPSPARVSSLVELVHLLGHASTLGRSPSKPVGDSRMFFKV